MTIDPGDVLELAALCEKSEHAADDRNSLTDDAEAYVFGLVKATLRSMAVGGDWRYVWRAKNGDYGDAEAN